MKYKPFRQLSDVTTAADGEVLSATDSYKRFLLTVGKSLLSKIEIRTTSTQYLQCLLMKRRRKVTTRAQKSKKKDVDQDDWIKLFSPSSAINEDLSMEELKLNANRKDYADYNWSASSSLFPPLSEAPKFVSDSRKEDSLAENTQASEKGLPPQEPAPGSEDFQRLKGEQKLAYDIVRTHHRFSPRKADDSCRPLRMIVCGSAGTGKSFLIKCLCDLLGSRCLLSAP